MPDILQSPASGTCYIRKRKKRNYISLEETIIMQFDHTIPALINGALAFFVTVGIAAFCTIAKSALKKHLRGDKNRADQQEVDPECQQE